jgi:hypothetical protein
MAVAFDAVGPAGGGGHSSTTSPTTWAHINSAAGNAIIVGINYQAGSSPQTTVVTYGAVSLSRLGTAPAAGTGPGGIELWGAIGGLPTGSNTVSATTTTGGNAITSGSVSFTGAATFSAAQTAVSSGNTTSISLNFTGTTSGNMIVATASNGNGSSVFATNSPGIQRWAVNGDSNTGADNTVGGTWNSPGGTQSIGFTETIAPADSWALAAVEVQAPAAAGVPGISQLITMRTEQISRSSSRIIQR